MKAKELRHETKLIRNYAKDLVLDEVRLEFTKSFILSQNGKQAKQDENAIVTLVNFGIELVPARLLDPRFNFCGNEGKCLMTCLFFGGFAMYGAKCEKYGLSTTIKKRIRRAYLFLNDRSFFVNKIAMEINSLSCLHEHLAIRLNVISDITWSDYIDFDQFKRKGLIFYDYTKRISNTENKAIHYTYSASEKDSNDKLINYLDKGSNVAIVLDIPKDKLPLEYTLIDSKGKKHTFPTINGTKNDNRYKDAIGHIILLSQITTINGKHKTKFIREVV